MDDIIATLAQRISALEEDLTILAEALEKTAQDARNGCVPGDGIPDQITGVLNSARDVRARISALAGNPTHIAQPDHSLITIDGLRSAMDRLRAQASERRRLEDLCATVRRLQHAGGSWPPLQVVSDHADRLADALHADVSEGLTLAAPLEDLLRLLDTHDVTECASLMRRLKSSLPGDPSHVFEVALAAQAKELKLAAAPVPAEPPEPAPQPAAPPSTSSEQPVQLPTSPGPAEPSIEPQTAKSPGPRRSRMMGRGSPAATVVPEQNRPPPAIVATADPAALPLPSVREGARHTMVASLFSTKTHAPYEVDQEEAPPGYAAHGRMAPSLTVAGSADPAPAPALAAILEPERTSHALPDVAPNAAPAPAATGPADTTASEAVENVPSSEIAETTAASIQITPTAASSTASASTRAPWNTDEVPSARLNDAASPVPTSSACIEMTERDAEDQSSTRFGHVPTHIRSFDAYRDVTWLAPGGMLERAPWQSPEFAKELSRRFEQECGQDPPRFSLLWLLAAAGESVAATTPRARDVEALATMWTSALVPATTGGLPRSEELRAANTDAILSSDLRWRVLMVLEAFGPSREMSLSSTEIEEIISAVDIENHDLRIAMGDLLRIGATHEQPMARIRAILGREPGTLAKTEALLVQQRRELYDLFDRAQRRRLFRFKTDFCQEVWLKFIREIAGELRHLFPPEHGGLASWEPERFTVFLNRIEAIHRDVADRDGARHDDRTHMDKWAQRIAVTAREIDASMVQIATAASRRSLVVAGKPVQHEAFRRLLDRTDSLPRADEDLFRRLLARFLVDPPPSARHEHEADPLAITLQDAMLYPDLLGLLPAARRGEMGTIVLGRAPEVSDFRTAGALLLRAQQQDDSHDASITGLLDLARTPERAHMLPALASQLSEEEQLRLHAEYTAQVEAADAAVARLRGEWRRLRDAASGMASTIGKVCDQAAELIEQATPHALRLIRAWLDAVAQEGAEEVARLGANLRTEALQRGDDMPERVDALLQSDRFAEAIALLRGSSHAEVQRQRHTLHRLEAGKVYGNPVKRLSEPDIEPLVPHWQQGIVDHNQERSLRTEFSKLILGKLHDEATRSNDRIEIQSTVLRRWLADRQLNPSYVPQLAGFRRLVIPSIGIPAMHPTFTQRAADVTAGFTSDLVVLLAPRLSSERREILLGQIRQRGTTAAVIDDIDLCRLLNPGGDRPNGVLGLLEIILEQLRWTAVSPFQLVEGQHVQIEMYVGRKEEARQLAQTPRFSRLFSGRKLGKSALLRFVERSFDGQRLPSGLTLRVVYVSAVGIETAAALVDQIADKLAERFGTKGTYQRRPAELASHRLVRITDDFLRDHQQESLLVVLDEADVFVEREIEEYERAREACLSFVMRSRVEERRDSQGLPRVRFVFTGYRVTNTREGAWANWGDVLKLVPLPATEAAELVAGPLARLGIDAADQAPSIAHRCGYQPAVILQFGERLLARLEERHPPVVRARKPVVVTAEDVAITFEDEVVQREIRTVVKNNFQGNPVGQIVFGTLLSEFLNLGPSIGLQHADEAVLRRLEALTHGDVNWLRPDGGSMRDEIKRHLGDFVERQLLIERRSPGQSPVYFLRFPHHLPVLAPLALEDFLGEAIRRRSQEGEEIRIHARTARGLLSRHDTGVIHDLLSKPEPSMPISSVVGSVWAPSVISDGGGPNRVFLRGLFEPIGLDRNGIVPVEDVLRSRREILSRLPRLAIIGVRESHIELLLGARPRNLPMPLLVGGADLLRAALRHEAVECPDGHVVFLQVLGTGRLTRSVLSWWFERARGFNFAEQDGIDRIAQTTSGIPLLVSALDARLLRRDPDGSGLEVTPHILQETLDELEADMPEIARQLVSGDAALRLSKREAELLRMMAHVVQEGGAGPSLEDLSEYWEFYREKSKNPILTSAAPVTPESTVEDYVALAFLQQVGLAPVLPEGRPRLPFERLARIDRDDAVLRLVSLLPE